MKINELDYKEIGSMLSDGYYDIFDKNRMYWNAEEYEIFTARIFYINNILIDGDKFTDGDYNLLLECLYEVYDYVIKKPYYYNQNIDDIIQCLKIYIDENF